MRLLTHIYWTISQTLLGIRVNKGPFMLAVTLAALALTIPIFIISVMVCLNDTVINVPMNTEITAFTERSAGPNTVKDLSQKINRLPGVTSVRIIPKDDALKMVNKSLGLQSKRSANNPLPDIMLQRSGTTSPKKTRKRSLLPWKNLRALSRPPLMTAGRVTSRALRPRCTSRSGFLRPSF